MLFCLSTWLHLAVCCCWLPGRAIAGALDARHIPCRQLIGAGMPASCMRRIEFVCRVRDQHCQLFEPSGVARQGQGG